MDHGQNDPLLQDRAEFDFAAAASLCGNGIAFGTGIDGKPLVFDANASPHVLLTGSAGSGKSILAQNLLYGAAINRAEIYVIDVAKGGADFAFVKPWAHAFATDLDEAAEVMKAVYAKMEQRHEDNAKAGALSYRDLPHPPPPIYVLVDEFAYLVSRDAVPQLIGDSELDPEREQIRAENAIRSAIGGIVDQIAATGRSAGVTLLLSTQRLQSGSGVAGMKANMARALLGPASATERVSALRDYEAAPRLDTAPPRGRGLWEPLGSPAVLVQVWYAPQSELAANLALVREPLAEVERLGLTPLLPKEVYPSPAGGLSGPSI